MTVSLKVDLETDYANPAQVQEHVQDIEIWARDAAAYRNAAGARATLDLPYGNKPRQRLDIFTPASASDAHVALFIHGGYWQTMDKSFFSHMARGANEHGITVAIAGYTLCPEATVSEIVGEIRQAVAFLAKRFGKAVTVYGHSAGGHLAACMLATDWHVEDSSLPADTVPAGLAISGLFELEPLVSTSINDKLGLDVEVARRLSPLFWNAPKNRSMIAYVGGHESSEFLRQTRSLVTRWSAAGLVVIGVEVSGATHFKVLSPLADPDSSMTRDLVTLARQR